MLRRCRMWAPPTSLCLGTCRSDSNGILINFSLYCNGALVGVLPLTVISYNTVCMVYMYMICAQYVICWTGPPVTPTGTALQLECGVGRHQCCSQPAQHEKDSLPGGPPDPESDIDDSVISIFINKIHVINPDKSFGSSDPMCILLLQLSSLLVEQSKVYTTIVLAKMKASYPMEELTATPPYPS
ncbi:hypothetical protein EMCRGX_G021829 [Ephydatia muelleri]